MKQTPYKSTALLSSERGPDVRAPSAARPFVAPLRHVDFATAAEDVIFFSKNCASLRDLLRAHREQLELTGAELNDALIAAADLQSSGRLRREQDVSASPWWVNLARTAPA